MVNNKNTIELELLAPAKDMETGKAAVLAGADAVYIGGPQFSARFAAGNSWKDIEELVKFAHQYHVKIYLAINTIFFDYETDSVIASIYKAYDRGVDAIIVQDMGIMEMELPPIPVFASTQTNNYDVEQVQFLEKAGFSRVILARECSLEQIKKIREATKVDLEFFVHGALCVSFSGRCYFSQSLCGKSANRGKCIQVCRMPFTLIDDNGKHLANDKFLLSLKDFNLSASLNELVDAGITSFKIEGRLKSDIYVSNVVAKYRQELDKIIAGSKGKYKKASSGIVKLSFDPDLERTFNRGYTNYFLHGRPSSANASAGKQNDIISLDSQKSLGKFMGKVKEIRKDCFILDRASDLTNADGLCWFDPTPGSGQALVGTNINSVSNGRIYPNKWPPLKIGTDIYRNMDVDFEKKVANGAERYVAADFAIKETDKGFSITAKDEDGNEVKTEFNAEKKLAEKPAFVEENWKKQLSKLGDTIFYARDFSFDLSKPYFLPLSTMNEWRRAVIAELYKKRVESYQRISADHIKTDNPYPHKELDYSFNVSNSLAKAFYERHGASVIQDSFEQQTNNKGRKIMTTKHCLRYFLGACPKNIEKGKVEFKEPLFLFYNGKKYPLKFDCQKCVMEIYNHN